MKKLSLLSALLGFFFIGAASAADISLYYSPTCPHCHHAREFFTDRIVYEYPDLRIVQINVANRANLPKFQEVLKKCEYDSGGVPVIVVGDKCFQGYADFMQQELRDAVEVDMSDTQKKTAAENRKALDDNADEFKKAHQTHQATVTEYSAETEQAVADDTQKKNNEYSSIWFYALLLVLVGALAFVLVRPNNKKKK